jgi:hypothetical protein
MAQSHRSLLLLRRKALGRDSPRIGG